MRTTIGDRGFGPDRRLSRSEDFERLMKQGTRRSAGGFVFFYERKAEGPARLGILISRRHAARATDRNRIKRCLREAFRQAHPGLSPMDLLIRPPHGMKPSARIVLQLQDLLSKLGR